MKKIFVCFVLLTIFEFFSVAWNTPYAGIFSNVNSYDECILENMRGVDSDLAAKQIVESCKNKYEMISIKELNGKNLDNIKLFNARVIKDNFICNIYNKNKKIIIKKIVLKISTTNVPSDYVAKLCIDNPGLLSYLPEYLDYTIEELKEILHNPQKRKDKTITNEYMVSINLSPLETTRLNFTIMADRDSSVENIEILKAYGNRP